MAVRWFELELAECVVEVCTADGRRRWHRPGCPVLTRTSGRKTFLEDGEVAASTDPCFIYDLLACKRCFDDDSVVARSTVRFA